MLLPLSQSSNLVKGTHGGCPQEISASSCLQHGSKAIESWFRLQSSF